MIVHLRAGKKRNGRQVAFEQSGVLDDEGVGAAFIHLADQVERGGEFGVMQQGVEGHVHPGPIAVRVLDQLRDVREGVPCVLTGSEARSADVDRVRAAVDGGDTAWQVLGGCE